MVIYLLFLADESRQRQKEVLVIQFRKFLFVKYCYPLNEQKIVFVTFFPATEIFCSEKNRLAMSRTETKWLP